MGAAQAGIVLRHLRELVSVDGASNLPDPDLLARFTRSHDEGAFTALVKRHGPLVLGVCRRVLGNPHDADDAFQATFLILARKAGSIARTTALPCWLYQVAYRVALKAKGQAATRKKCEQRAGERQADDPLAEITGRELLGVLDEELQTLPEHHRGPLVLCYLEGHTCEEAARRLGCSPRTLKRWLEQARRCLGRRLARRGLGLSAALLAAGASRAAVPSRLAAETAAGALRLGAAPGATASPPVSSAAVALAEGALRAAPAAKLRTLSVLATLAGVAALAVGALALPGADSSPPAASPGRGGAAAAPARPLLPAAGAGKEMPAPRPRTPPKGEKADHPVMLISGVVVNAEGKPLANAPVAVAGLSRDIGRGGDLVTEQTRVLAQGKTDAEGRFRLKAPGANRGRFFNLYALARAPGHGLAVRGLNLALAANDVTLKLAPEQPVRGRLVDLQGQPAAGVTVLVGWVGQARNGESHGVHFHTPPPGLAVWPEPVKTDAQGRYTVRGLGAAETVSLAVRDDRFAPQSLFFGAPTLTKEINGSLSPAQFIEGQVLQADTDKPVAHALLTVYSSDREAGSYGGLGGRADAEGRFRLNPYPGKWFTVSARAPEGEPYLSLEKRFQWPAGKVKMRLDLKLPRGVLVRGKVTEAGSGKPVPQASVQYFPQEKDNPDLPRGFLSGWQAIEKSGADGAFQLAVPPGPGHLLVIGPGGEYIHEEISNGMLYEGRPSGMRYYPDAVVRLALKKATKVHEVAVTLRRGVTVTGRVLGVDGRPLKGKALMMTRLNVTPLSPFWRFPVEVRDGQFELRGLDPEKSYPVAFLEPAKAWGATVQISGKQAGKPVTVKLQPCGRAVARYVDGAGKPLAGHRPMIDIVVTPGTWRYNMEAGRKGLVMADEEHLANVDRHNYWKGPQADAEGRCTFVALIPGTTYRLPTYQKGGHRIGREFVAASGKTFDAGTITFQP
jgi:RNA polymerase sigma factor (sigma-70 family)